MDYHKQTVEIIINRESELYRKICERARRDGISVEAVVDMLMTLGSHLELEKKLKMLDRMEGRKK